MLSACAIIVYMKNYLGIHISTVDALLTWIPAVVFFTALAVSSEARVPGSKSKVSQFNIRTWNKLYSTSTSE